MPDDLQDVVARLTQLEKDFHAYADEVASSSQQERSRAVALFSIVQDIAKHLGISADDLLRHYHRRRAFYYERDILAIGDQRPDLADQMDERDPGAEPEEPFAPLFPDDP